ncbi:uncharacterized protein [Phaseolus vulgaris]|uniref:uncharacterized protein n=1 Tax=Phaseolus vulgaris TaxID=3885 RepID=UPI0035CC95CD
MGFTKVGGKWISKDGDLGASSSVVADLEEGEHADNMVFQHEGQPEANQDAGPSADSMSGKDRRLAVLELAKRRATKGIGSSSSTTEPIEAPPLSVAPAEGPEQGKKRKRLVKASSLVPVAAAASVEEESSGSPLIHHQRKRPVVEGVSSLQPGEIEVVEVEEGSPPPPPSTRPAPEPACPPSPCQQLPPISQPPTSAPAGQSPGPSAHPAGGASA